MEKELTAWERLKIVHNPNRPNALDLINGIFENYYEFQGDGYFGEDKAITAGIATFQKLPVTVIANLKGKNLEENKLYNFSMAHPEGYRKALRLAKQAEKFKRPIVCFVDITGAFCGVDAEKRGQGQAIAKNIMEFMNLKTPIISIITGEGGSGGALGLGVCDELSMFENAVYSVISPRGAASILWKDPKKEEEAANTMKVTAKDMLNFKVADFIIKEPAKGADKDPVLMCENVVDYLIGALKRNLQKNVAMLLESRYNKFRKIGIFGE